MADAERPADDERPYHHGDLREALLSAAEAELREKGVEGFTLRGCAKRAGVSHAAPAHHFRDANGLLTALAERGFRRFVETQRRRQAVASPEPREQYVASGLGYIDFALTEPALFRLMFSSQRIDFDQEGLHSAGEAGFNKLVREVAAVTGHDPEREEAAMTDVVASWSIVHGLADLLQSGRLSFLQEKSEAAREAILKAIIRRAIPVDREDGPADLVAGRKFKRG